MKTKHTIYINVSPEIGKIKYLEEIINEYNNVIEKAEPAHPSLVIVEIIGNDMIVNSFVKELKLRGFEFRHIKRRTYSKSEIQKAELAWITVPTPWTHADKTSEEFGTTYSNANCVLCGYGKKQFSDLYLPMIKASKYDICGIGTHIIINKSVQNMLSNLNFTGYELAPVRDNRSKILSDLKQLVVTNILPPMSPETGAIMTKCPKCGRLVLDYVFDEIVFNRVDLLKFANFNLTKEEFSMMNGNATSCGLIIVNKNVIEEFLKYEVKGVHFEPIVIK